MRDVYESPKNLAHDIDLLEKDLEAYEVGKIDALAFRAKRVPFGIYEQRQSGRYMVRVRCAAGIITPSQLKTVSEIASKQGSGRLHVTTRQEVQIHDIALTDLIGVLRELLDTGLSSRGGGGNTLRNIIAPPDTGVAKGRVFDVTPHAIAVTRALAHAQESLSLPRKYKIGFSDSSFDFGHARISDLGFIAIVKDGRRGFEVHVAGGLGARPALAKLFLDFVPETDVIIVATAIRNLYAKFGNRKNRHAARLRFLYDKVGEASFRRLYKAERSALDEATLLLKALPEFPEGHQGRNVEDKSLVPRPGFAGWKDLYVGEQMQTGLATVLLALKMGDLQSGPAGKLADFLKSFGENSLRFTLDQNLLLRNIPEARLPEIFAFAERELGLPDALQDSLVPCAGADTCKLGICLSRGASVAVFEELSKAKLDFAGKERPRVHISGCPNSCGQHWIADLGFYGFSASKEGRKYPAYTVVGGGRTGPGSAVMAAKLGDIAARDLPRFVLRVLKSYLDQRDGPEAFSDYLRHSGMMQIGALLREGFMTVPSFDADPSYYRDWGSEKNFSLEGRSAGECSAGIFDFIERDLKKIEETKKALAMMGEESSGKAAALRNLVYHSARMLLITKGLDASDAGSVGKNFKACFIGLFA